GFELDEQYVEISQQKLKQIKSDFKIGDSWVSFYLNDIATIRNNDWAKLEPYFDIPNPIRAIDYQKTTLKKGTVTQKEIEFQLEDDTEKGSVIIPIFSQREKLASYVTASTN
ncbi:MAG: hypothetical protein LBC98_00690, partial [Prevotellaceae bacterium]|nr:hypothetical protein [Prevotellaceae bacterium]